jgi:hypothetical protein
LQKDKEKEEDNPLQKFNLAMQNTQETNLRDADGIGNTYHITTPAPTANGSTGSSGTHFTSSPHTSMVVSSKEVGHVDLVSADLRKKILRGDDIL